jgi:hypothetical protein
VYIAFPTPLNTVQKNSERYADDLYNMFPAETQAGYNGFGFGLRSNAIRWQTKELLPATPCSRIKELDPATSLVEQ